MNSTLKFEFSDKKQIFPTKPEFPDKTSICLYSLEKDIFLTYWISSTKDWLQNCSTEG